MFADKYDSERLKIEGSRIDWFPIEELIAGAGWVRCLVVVCTCRFDTGNSLRWIDVMEVYSLNYFRARGTNHHVAVAQPCHLGGAVNLGSAKSRGSQVVWLGRLG